MFSVLTGLWLHEQYTCQNSLIWIVNFTAHELTSIKLIFKRKAFSGCTDNELEESEFLNLILDMLDLRCL